MTTSFYKYRQHILRIKQSVAMFLIRVFIFSIICITAHADEPFDAHQRQDIINNFDVSESWKSAIIYSPNSLFPISIQAFFNDNPANVIIHLHGCGGIKSDEIQWAKLLSNNGFYVLLPNSMAIPGRKLNCDSQSHNRNVNNFPASLLRVREALYVQDQVKALSSIKRIFLMGHSEGGAAVLTAPMTEFFGVISIGSYCNKPEIKIVKTVPLLLINFEKDPWFAEKKYSCKEKISSRQETTTELILQGRGHAASSSLEARNAVVEFLKKLSAD